MSTPAGFATRRERPHVNRRASLHAFGGPKECLNEHWFSSLAHARSVIEASRIEYNTERLNSSLRNRTPDELAVEKLDLT
jgi:hypothetical protein